MRVSMPWSEYVGHLATAGLVGAALALLVVLAVVRLRGRRG